MIFIVNNISLMFLSIIFFSCTPIKNEKEDLIGKWQYVEFYFNEHNVSKDVLDAFGYVRFDEYGLYQIFSPEGEHLTAGEWTFLGKGKIHESAVDWDCDVSFKIEGDTLFMKYMHEGDLYYNNLIPSKK